MAIATYTTSVSLATSWNTALGDTFGDFTPDMRREREPHYWSTASKLQVGVDNTLEKLLPRSLELFWTAVLTSPTAKGQVTKPISA